MPSPRLVTWAAALAAISGALLCAAAPEYTIATRKGELTTLVYQSLADADASLIGGATIAIGKDGPYWPSSQAFGRGVRAGQRMDLSACTNMNTMFELLTSASLVKLFQDTQFTPSLDDPIAASLSPFGIPIVNPTTGVAVTYRHLMQHTSTITDSGFSAYTRTTPATVGSLASFVEAYLTTGSGGTLQPSAFSSREPGSPSAYSFARANIALVAYIINRVISTQGLSYLGVADYAFQNFVAPMGLSSTFFLQTDGSAAKVVAPPAYSGAFTGVDPTNAANYAAFYQNCIVDQDMTTSGVLIHPAFVSDYMPYTTAEDIARLVFNLFLSGKQRWTTVSNELRSVFVLSQNSGRVPFQTATGLGLMFFDGQAMCDTALAAGVLSSCPLVNITRPYGYLTSRDKVQTGFVCGDDTSIGPLCVVNTFVFSGASSSRDATAFVSLTAATFQDLAGDPFAASGVVVAPPEKDEWFGVYVFLGVYGTLVVVYIITKIVIYWGMQISIAANTNTGGAAQLATPKKQSVLD